MNQNTQQATPVSLQTSPCHRCGVPFVHGETTVCGAQPYSDQIVVCAERPWVDAREEEGMKRRISMHKLIWFLQGGTDPAKPAVQP